MSINERVKQGLKIAEELDRSLDKCRLLSGLFENRIVNLLHGKIVEDCSNESFTDIGFELESSNMQENNSKKDSVIKKFHDFNLNCYGASIDKEDCFVEKNEVLIYNRKILKNVLKQKYLLMQIVHELELIYNYDTWKHDY